MAHTWETENIELTFIVRSTKTLWLSSHLNTCSPSYHSNSWRRQQVSGGHHSEVSNVDHHIADRHQGDPNDDGPWQIPAWQQTCCCPVTCVLITWKCWGRQHLRWPSWECMGRLTWTGFSALLWWNSTDSYRCNRANKWYVYSLKKNCNHWVTEFLLQLHSSRVTVVKPANFCSACWAKLLNFSSVPFNIPLPST